MRLGSFVFPPCPSVRPRANYGRSRSGSSREWVPRLRPNFLWRSLVVWSLKHPIDVYPVHQGSGPSIFLIKYSVLAPRPKWGRIAWINPPTFYIYQNHGRGLNLPRPSFLFRRPSRLRSWSWSAVISWGLLKRLSTGSTLSRYVCFAHFAAYRVLKVVPPGNLWLGSNLLPRDAVY